jgi:pseudaminic acid cytidylyltransferase
MNICIIPARGGSKRIPRKNIKAFNRKPIIAYSIEATIESNCFDKVMVSTDDSEISKVAEVFGAEVPFILPRYLVQDIDSLEDWKEA